MLNSKVLLVIFCCLVVASFAKTTFAQAEEVQLGRWKMSTEFQGRKIPAILSLSFTGEQLTGSWKSQGQVMELLEISLQGKKLSFKRAMGSSKIRFEGEFKQDSLVGEYSAPFGKLHCTGTKITTVEPETLPKKNQVLTNGGRPIIEKDGKSLLWAKESEDGKTEYFDVTDAAIDPSNFDHGIGKDTIASIDEPTFVVASDSKLAEIGITSETQVLGVFINGVAKAYPVYAMSRHEIVNDNFAGTAYAVLW